MGNDFAALGDNYPGEFYLTGKQGNRQVRKTKAKTASTSPTFRANARWLKEKSETHPFSALAPTDIQPHKVDKKFDDACSAPVAPGVRRWCFEDKVIRDVFVDTYGWQGAEKE